MQAFGDVVALVYVGLLFSLMAYWPLQVIVLVVARDNDRMVGFGILAFTLLVFASFGGGPDESNFPPPYVVVLVTLSNLALVALMVHAVMLRRR